jgi:hypothetical protein
MQKLTATAVKRAKPKAYKLWDGYNLLSKKIILLAVALVPHHPQSAEAEPWSKYFAESISYHVANFEEKVENDPSGAIADMIYVSQRCYGALSFIGVSFEKANSEVSERYMLQASKSLEIGARFSSAYETQTGQQQSIEAYERGLKLMVKQYTDWANDNYISSGENTNSNMQGDLRACIQFLSIF